MKFSAFKQAVANQFAGMQAYPLFRTTVKGDDLWDAYLNAFPANSNPLYRERSAHDCSCCRQFIRTVGNVVALKEGKMVSIWDGQLPADEPEYQIVSRALSAVACAYPIENVFLHTEKTVGTDRNFEQLLDGQQEWQHFFVALPPAYVIKKDALGSTLGETRSSYDVFRRALLEISFDAIDTTLELINQNTLYRGAEFKAPVELFKKMKLDFNGTDEFIWGAVVQTSPSILRIRNSAIGTLLVDLSDGREIDAAVASFESKVAPTNYKRPSAVVTPRMIEDAKKKVEELGLTPSLMRRYATIDDVTVNNVLFVDRSSSLTVNDDDVFGGLATKASPKNLSKVMDVPIEKFLKDIVPTATSIELLLDNGHVGNLVSLIAPIHPTAPQLFKWNNPFSWAYNGQLADSMKEKVKAAGGNIEADVCFRLAWEYTDDLDLHLNTPVGRVYFANRENAGWTLDVDANGGNGMREHPVENIFIKNRSKIRNGQYTLVVNNFRRRSGGTGFEVEIDIAGTIHAFAYTRALRDSESVLVATLSMKDGSIDILPGPGMEKNTMQKEAWNIQTNTFQKVGAIMLSPNYWDEQAAGNKHWFFMLEGCRNEGQARGFFNEFLINDLTPHRKVLEMVGAKVQTEQAQHQLSGVGFSSTQSNRVLCRVKGSFNRLINIIF